MSTHSSVTINASQAAYKPLVDMDLHAYGDEKLRHEHDLQQTTDEIHPQRRHESNCQCQRERCRTLFRLLLVAIAVIVSALVALFVLSSCMSTEAGSDIGMSLFRRQTNGSGSDESAFTKNHLYLIVIFVGLVVVVILAIMLSAWCCRGAFQNPLCCPCYLCACCGGLACLECIGCGLCAEGLDQV